MTTTETATSEPTPVKPGGIGGKTECELTMSMDVLHPDQAGKV
jgi:hypothetical protein